MHIQVNGESRQVREEINVTGLLQDLQLNVERVAVEINLEILDRRDFDARILEEGDRIEIMSFIGGGGGRLLICDCELQMEKIHNLQSKIHNPKSKIFLSGDRPCVTIV